MMLTFTFTTKHNEQGEIEEIVFSGNINPEVALRILPQIVVAEAQKQAQLEAQQAKPKHDEKINKEQNVENK